MADRNEDVLEKFKNYVNVRNNLVNIDYDEDCREDDDENFFGISEDGGESSGEGSKSTPTTTTSSSENVKDDCKIITHAKIVSIPTEFKYFLEAFKKSFMFCKFVAKGMSDAIYFAAEKKKNDSNFLGRAQFWVGVYNLVKNKVAKGKKYLKMAERNLDPDCELLDFDNCWFLEITSHTDQDVVLKVFKDLPQQTKLKVKLDEKKMKVALEKCSSREQYMPLQLQQITNGAVAFETYEDYKQCNYCSEMYYFLKFAAFDCQNKKAEAEFMKLNNSSDNICDSIRNRDDDNGDSLDDNDDDDRVVSSNDSDERKGEVTWQSKIKENESSRPGTVTVVCDLDLPCRIK
ncbi:hypothetical protein HELRODRAFT_163189 [Helobdella robusta]|uniref:Uncharacterized protein n=1 Tax=Helobdella robusta TaxID=6412 RepID=T1ETS4_HELRO|nr:hypothetical protein HELRODRAFT_163189 [Helobdella robusta]ESN96157.1 hypothetical protein HELRODRAFT_163189 [Helobdella robusta]